MVSNVDEESSESKGSCPCLYTTPCHPRCTCVDPFSSRGCECCCSYGSIEQRKSQADYIKSCLDMAKITRDISNKDRK